MENLTLHCDFDAGGFEQGLDFCLVDLACPSFASAGVDEDEQSLGPPCYRMFITKYESITLMEHRIINY